MRTQAALGWGDGPARRHPAPLRGHRSGRAPKARLSDLGLSPETLTWPEQAHCRDTDPDAFFPEVERVNQLGAVRRICHGCPVRQQCLNYAMDHPELVGVWGGLTTSQRRRRRRGTRARHTPAAREAA